MPLPLYVERWAWAASKITLRLWALARASTPSISTGQPYMWVATMARALGPTLRAASATLIWPVAGSASTKTGMPPLATTMLTEAMYDQAGTSTSSPRLKRGS